MSTAKASGTSFEGKSGNPKNNFNQRAESEDFSVYTGPRPKLFTWRQQACPRWNVQQCNDAVGRTYRTADIMLISKSTTTSQGAKVRPVAAQLARRCTMFSIYAHNCSRRCVCQQTVNERYVTSTHKTVNCVQLMEELGTITLKFDLEDDLKWNC